MTSKKIRSIFTESKQNADNLRSKYPVAALNELMKDAALIRHKKTLDEIAKAMTRAIESDQKWSEKCKKLEFELLSKASKIKSALQLSEEDKNLIDTLKAELESAWMIIEKMQKSRDSANLSSVEDNNTDEMFKHSKQIIIEDNEKFKKLAKENVRLSDEAEKAKLEIFEMEEQLANKEKMNEDLIRDLNSKLKDLTFIKKENENLKTELQEYKTLANFTTKQKFVSQSKTDSNRETKLLKKMQLLRKQLQDERKRDKISLGKLRHLLQKNKLLYRQFQGAKNQSKLLNLQLSEQNKTVNLLSSHCCKLEERDTKQAAAIRELEKVRNRQVQITGKLEEKINNLNKELMTYKVEINRKLKK